METFGLGCGPPALLLFGPKIPEEFQARTPSLKDSRVASWLSLKGSPKDKRRLLEAFGGWPKNNQSRTRTTAMSPSCSGSLVPPDRSSSGKGRGIMRVVPVEHKKCEGALARGKSRME